MGLCFCMNTMISKLYLSKSYHWHILYLYKQLCTIIPWLTWMGTHTREVCSLWHWWYHFENFYFLCTSPFFISSKWWTDFCCCFYLFANSCPTLYDPTYYARQSPLSMRFSRQETWRWLSFPSPGSLPDPGFELVFPALAGSFFSTKPPGKPEETSSLIHLNGSISWRFTLLNLKIKIIKSS